jgi:predicted O-methyltransferase YrrM
MFARPILDPVVMAEMSTHPERIGESSWGTRNVLSAFVLSMRPKLFLEIGSHIGCGAVTVGSAMRANGFGRMVCLEPMDHYFALLNQFIERAGVRDFVQAVQMLSTDPKLPEVLGEMADMIFIDANHSYSHALKDLEISLSNLAEGGLIFVDDVGHLKSAGMCEEGRGGVRQALIDFGAEHADEITFTILDSPFWLNPQGLGIVTRKCHGTSTPE